MSIKTRLRTIEQATQPKPTPRPIEVHSLTSTEAGCWTYDNKPVTDEQAISIARRKTHKNHFTIIRGHADQSLAGLADISLKRSYV